MTSIATPIGRVLLALIFILSGANKLADPAATGAYMQSAGLPALLALPAGLFELVAALMIALGWLVRPVALILAGFCLVTAVLFHGNVADQVQMVMLLKNIALAGAFLLVFAHGAGAFSIDNRRSSKGA